MKKVLLLLLLVQQLVSCETNANKKAETPEEKAISDSLNYVSLKKEHLQKNLTPQKTFLDFQFGWNEKETKEHIERLVKENRLYPESTLTWSVLGLSVKGNRYDIQLNDSLSCTGHLTKDYFDCKLYTLTLFIYGECEERGPLNFLHSIYGKPVYTIDKGYGIYQAFWLKNGYQVMYNTDGFNTIEFTDLRLKELEDAAKKQVDSLNTELNKDKASQTKSDFK